MGRNWSNNLGMKKNASYTKKKKKKKKYKQTNKTNWLHCKMHKGTHLLFFYLLQIPRRWAREWLRLGRWGWEGEWVGAVVGDGDAERVRGGEGEWECRFAERVSEAFDWWGRVSGWVTEREWLGWGRRRRRWRWESERRRGWVRVSEGERECPSDEGEWVGGWLKERANSKIPYYKSTFTHSVSRSCSTSRARDTNMEIETLMVDF